MATKEHKIDAAGKALGRVATEAVKLLRGKDAASFERNIAPDISVVIINASKMDVSPKKMKTKLYHHYSGYPGGMKEQTLSQVVAKKGFSEALSKAIYGMLPSNRLRNIMMKNLTISE